MNSLIVSKEELRTTRENVQMTIDLLDEFSQKINSKSKLNLTFTVCSLAFTIFYPLVMSNVFLVPIYLMWWLSSLIFIGVQFKLFSMQVATETRKAIMQETIGAVDEELENIRKKEYDELKRKVGTQTNGQDLSGTGQAAAES